MTERLATEFGAVWLPGRAFGPGQEQHLRMAFANLELEAVGDLVARVRGLGSGW